MLTQEDLATLPDSDPKTIRKDIKRYQRKYGILIPTRGNKKDIGPGITHREKAVELYLQGKDAVAIARDLQHSVKAVERYTQMFKRLLYCQRQVRNSLKTALIFGISNALVNRYLALRDAYIKTEGYQQRIAEIEEEGAGSGSVRTVKKIWADDKEAGMKAKTTPPVAPPYEKKGFKAVLNFFLAEQVPQLGGELTRRPIVDHIAAMVQEYFLPTKNMQMWQMLWYAVDEKEKSGYGKSLDKCKQRPVILDIIHETDIDDILNGVKKRERREKVAVRFFKQAYEQKGVLTHADVGAIMRLAPGTVCKYIVGYEKESGTMVPRRGNIHDMGPTLTHKKVICQKIFGEGKSVKETARETYHSPAAVVRYANDFKRVRECLKERWSHEKTAFATGLSLSLTNEYVDCNTPLKSRHFSGKLSLGFLYAAIATF